MHKTLLRVAALALVASAATLAESRPMRIWKWSLGALIAGNGIDAMSSWGRQELNPVLARGGKFGGGSAALKFGVVGALALAERLALKRDPGMVKHFAVANYAAAGVFTGVAVRNWRNK